MSAVTDHQAQRDARATQADILDLLARIHEREADGALVDGLRRHGVGAWMAEALGTAEAREAAREFAAAIDAIATPLDAGSADALASDFADIYLSHAARVSPNASYWLSEDHLERQEPMFEARQWYRQYNMATPDWRKRPDDNLVCQLQFLALLLRHDEAPALADAARFLDGGLLRWLPAFAAGVALRAGTAFYATAAHLTAATVDEIRGDLARATGIARDRPEAPMPDPVASLTGPYVPGQAESW